MLQLQPLDRGVLHGLSQLLGRRHAILPLSRVLARRSLHPRSLAQAGPEGSPAGQQDHDERQAFGLIKRNNPADPIQAQIQDEGAGQFGPVRSSVQPG